MAAAAKQTFSLWRELKITANTAYNCDLSAPDWPEQTPRDENMITLNPRCAKFNHVRRCQHLLEIKPNPIRRVSSHDCVAVTPESHHDPSVIRDPDVARNLDS